MLTDVVEISQITKKITPKRNGDDFAVCWIQNPVKGLEVDDVFYENLSNSIFFLDPKFNWKLYKDDNAFSGYVLYVSKELLNHPTFANLHINQVRLFNQEEIPMFQLSPGIEKRTQAILEMIDELLASHLNHKEDAVLSLLNTFFVYCDGQCNIKSVISTKSNKTSLVYKYKQLVDQHVCTHHNVNFYADQLHISSKYLNDCVQEVLSVSAKSIIVEQLLMRARSALKFSDKTIKEIGFDIGFSSADYFSSFFKKHTGSTPSAVRKS
ncbi:MAG: helix-turn-helix domain-containing protein [Marinirhabdus sp.]|nr:helix-turn-helix domain-containing protein [Marinirhabdus sp.]